MNSMSLRVLLVCSVVPLALAGCWNATTSHNELMQQGAQRGVPFLIYNTSWNHITGDTYMGSGSLAVGLVNTGRAQIQSVELFVSSCPMNAHSPKSHLVKFNGPFLPGQAYVTRYQYAPQGSYYSAGATREYRAIVWATRHLVIQAVKITDASGVETTYRDNVGRFLAPLIANYCLEAHNATLPGNP